MCPCEPPDRPVRRSRPLTHFDVALHQRGELVCRSRAFGVFTEESAGWSYPSVSCCGDSRLACLQLVMPFRSQRLHAHIPAASLSFHDDGSQRQPDSLPCQSPLLAAQRCRTCFTSPSLALPEPTGFSAWSAGRCHPWLPARWGSA